MSANGSKTGAQVVVESLENHGVQYVFGIPGAKIDKVFDTLRGSSIQTIVCRHEQNAGVHRRRHWKADWESRRRDRHVGSWREQPYNRPGHSQ